ncbi:hypothetical protein L1887_27553 [Cichorium endivia]|nr:hypothetical protein L1887_27553 [Cichorium endivia]
MQTHYIAFLLHPKEKAQRIPGEALDTARTQWYHAKAIIIAGMCFFTDAYDLFCISTVSKLLGRLYFSKHGSSDPGKLPDHINNIVTRVAVIGTVIGQLIFGWLGDKIGRKKVYGITLLLMVICAICSGLSFGYSPKAVIGTLCILQSKLDACQNLTQKNIFPAMGLTKKARDVNAPEEMFLTSRAMFIIAMFGTFPGYWFTVGFIEKIGRKQMAVPGISRWASFLPAELFPTRVRSTCHAMSAAAGKARAMVSAFGFRVTL